MTKPPIRVVAQPPSSKFPQSQHYSTSSTQDSFNSSQCGYSSNKKTSSLAIPTISVSPMANRSYGDMLSYAEQQRKQIEMNRREADRRQTMRAQGESDAAKKIVLIRKELAEEEGELRRLSELERETRILTKRNVEKETELSQLSSELREQQRILRTAAGRVEALKWQIDELYRRRKAAAAAALSEQRKMQQQTTRMPEPSRVVLMSERPRASVEPFQVNISAVHDVDTEVKEEKHALVDVSSLEDESSSELLPSPPQEPSQTAPLPSSYVPVIGTESSVSNNRCNASPSPPKDPHPTSEDTSTASTQQTVKSSVSKRTIQHQEFIMSSSFADSLDESKLRTGKTDLVSIRNDSLKAAKRRSWAASEGITLPEADTIRRILEEQRRGKNHFLPELPTPHDESKVEVNDGEKENLFGSDKTITTDDESIAKSDDDIEMEVNRRTVKSILRPIGLKKQQRHIEFDPLALLLDAALEGELDLVKSSAAKLSDVSVANDEGITALHNAICAGHYEIVKFLIESDADVNAQDSDGWTPLHCAASCNNLPMVRQLVEGGACVLASTMSDMETPVEKCEEDEEGYDSCLRYLTAAHNSTGTINNGIVYAAYDYDAQYDDELTFKAGDELRVVSKDDKEKNWWTCERVGHNGEVGLVPRTYVALYPALRHRKGTNFLMFELPMEHWIGDTD
ncbi:SH3 domain protein [Dictyocaulus viviparus]|uniref:SH3 domain protein n=1 Tax=Dictyocaulus viviparus TaxID=29172 RepID=A0A0D8YAA9_DICVI|nr:SH3 domain protein [Dictyocaulus viviparus]